ncbi:unnamed protein product, partial [Ectocarpus sp. 4 AP-2014]
TCNRGTHPAATIDRIRRNSWGATTWAARPLLLGVASPLAGLHVRPRLGSGRGDAGGVTVCSVWLCRRAPRRAVRCFYYVSSRVGPILPLWKCPRRTMPRNRNA